MREKLVSAGIEMVKIEGFQTEQGKLKVKKLAKRKLMQEAIL
jgi:hypothetical protein